ncbi:MAG: ImmA/IrrE family metallo-endopeptidase [Acidobacteriota bacterium]
MPSRFFIVLLNPTGAAASTVSSEFGAAVLLNSRSVRWRRNFDLAHELFHLVTWPVFHTGETAPGTINDQEERLAQAFASTLLMPDEAIKAAIAEHQREGKLSFEELFDIARQFDVSMDALLWRLHFLYGRSESQTKADIEKCRTNVFDKRSDTQPDSLPNRYEALAIRTFRRGDLSTGRFAQYMGISRDAALSFADEEGDDEEISLPSD